MSGVTPSKCRAPSNTVEASQAPCVRGPMIGTLPSCHLPSKNVSVRDQLATCFLLMPVSRHKSRRRGKGQRAPCMGTSDGGGSLHSRRRHCEPQAKQSTPKRQGGSLLLSACRRGFASRADGGGCVAP